MPRIFLVGENNELIKMDKAEFGLEADLQSLLAHHPDLLECCTSDSQDQERKLLLIRREMGVPDREDGGDRWAMDHFYIDQEGIPTLVEVKRSRNGQLRREVIGQLLDYAANAAAYWTIEAVMERFQSNWGAERAQNALDSFLEGTKFETTDDFWRQVKTNLEAANIRLVFVAEELPSQLKRVIEFLNEQMRHVEVLGVELGHFSDGASRAIVPSVIGRTTQAEATKGRVPRQPQNYEFLESVAQEFQNLAGGHLPLSAHRGNFRQVRLDPMVAKSIHYEVLSTTRMGITCEFHDESSMSRPALRNAMQLLSQQGLGGQAIDFRHRGLNGSLRFVPSDQTDPIAVARAMLEFIDQSRDALRSAALAPID